MRHATIRRGARPGGLTEPLSFTVAVLVFGATFRLLRDYLDQLLRRIIRLLGPADSLLLSRDHTRLSCSLHNSGRIALVFVEAVSLLRCERWAEIAATIFACFAIGFGAGPHALGMPGCLIVLRSLHADFWYLTHLLGPFALLSASLSPQFLSCFYRSLPASRWIQLKRRIRGGLSC